MLAGIFHIVRRYCYQFRLVGPEMATNIGYAVASSVAFELMFLAHQYHSESVLADCSTIQNIFGYFIPYLKCSPTLSAHFLWRLNVITVVSKLIIEILFLLATALGGSFGSFMNSFFNELSWLLFIPSAFVCVVVALFSVIAIFRYELTIFGFLSFRPSSIPIEKPHASPPPPYDTIKYATVQPRPFHIVKEIYQRLSP